MTDSTASTSGDDLPATTWVTVADAAEKSGVGTSTIRQWYRSGRLATQRSAGDHGAFLVPLDGVLALARGDEEADELTAEVIDLNASYWSAQTEAAREEAAAAKHDLAQARADLQSTAEEVEALRAQLADAADEARGLRERVEAMEAEEAERLAAPAQEAVAPEGGAGDRADLEADLADAEAELDEVRAELAEVRSGFDRNREELQRAQDEVEHTTAELQRTREELQAVTAELERTSHDAERTSGQLEVMQRQLKAAQAELAKLKEISSAVGSITDNSWLDLPTNSYRSPVRPQGMAAAADGLSGLLAATQPDPVADDAAADDPSAAEPEVEPVELAHDPEAPVEAVTAPPVRPHHQLGHHDDDLLPQPEKKGRRGRR